jgi:hypothetical protein
MAMKALRQPAVPDRGNTVPPCSFAFPQRLKIPKFDILPQSFLKNSGMDHPNELLKTKGRGKKGC